MAEKRIRVILADDHAMVREALAALISGNDIDVVAQCGNGLQVIDLVRQHSPEVVLLDITMPGLNGLDICREITRRFPDTAVLILTMHDDQQLIARALEHGASGYMLKEAAAGQLIVALHTVARGELYLGPGIPRTVLQHIGKGDHDPYETLTARERQVLQLIAEGKTNRQVADALHLSFKTVDTHRSHLMRKLDLHDQTSLVKFALRRGIIPLK